MNKQKSYQIIVGFTGSVASIKSQELINEIRKQFNNQVIIWVVITKRAEQFVQLDENTKIYRDDDEWSTWKQRNDPVLHIELRKWADCLVIAPLSANTMAKIVNGLCDNLLTNIIRAWDYRKPMIVAPAMNTVMYENPITIKQMNKLKKLGVLVIDPIEKMLMCGEIGKGAMEEPIKIAERIYSAL